MNQENIKKLKQLNLSNMATYYQNYVDSQEFITLDFDSKLAVLLDYEITARQNKKIAILAKKANFKVKPDLTTIDYSPERNLSREMIVNLASCTWIINGKNLVVSGATGTGKTYLVSALGYRTCMFNYKVGYIRVPRLMLDINISKTDGSYNN